MMDVLDKIRLSKPKIKEEDLELIREITSAKNQAKPIAGAIQTDEDGGWKDGNDLKPTNQIHEFKDLSNCDCDCHGIGKIDCEKCYDHPKHLEDFKRHTL